MPEVAIDILEEIPDNEVPRLCDLIAAELPLSRYVYGFVTTCYEWRKKNPAYDVTFYQWKENLDSGVFIGTLYSGNKTFGLIPYAREGYENELEHALLNTTKINWKQKPLIQGVLPRHTTLIENVVKKKKYSPKVYVDTTVQVLDSEKALTYKIKIPNNVYVRQLTEADIDSIYESWPHKDVYNIDEIKYSISLSVSSGLFSIKDDEILAWAMHCHYGAIGMLYTKENVRRHGYAKILVMIMSQELAKRNIPPYAMIMESNLKSISLFHSVGYEQISPMKYFSIVEK